MNFQDKQLNCQDCSKEFTFTANEQQFYADKGFDNEPKRCPECRAIAKQNRNNDRSGGGGGGGRDFNRAPRQMFKTTCGNCQKEAMVPFEPKGDRPVLCGDCFRASRA